jgi:glucose-1-phosphate cytidylyltransferase
MAWLMKVAILAGGLGTRLATESERRPKPLAEIGGRPILWHIMKYYSCFGLNQFVIALGHKGDDIRQFFHNYASMKNEVLPVSLGTDADSTCSALEARWLVDLVDTGEKTETGGRIRRLAPWVRNGTFMLTYSDGLANVDLHRLLAFHRAHGKLVTVTAVPEPSRFGVLDLEEDGSVRAFVEKPRRSCTWISGGYFIVEPGVLEYICGDGVKWEEEPLQALASEGQVVAYRHDSFWQCMDTPKELQQLNDLWRSGQVPWKIWE